MSRKQQKAMFAKKNHNHNKDCNCKFCNRPDSAFKKTVDTRDIAKIETNLSIAWNDHVRGIDNNLGTARKMKKILTKLDDLGG